MPISVYNPKGRFECALTTTHNAEMYARLSSLQNDFGHASVELSFIGNYSVSWEFADADLVEAIEFLEFVRMFLQKRKQEA